MPECELVKGRLVFQVMYCIKRLSQKLTQINDMSSLQVTGMNVYMDGSLIWKLK